MDPETALDGISLDDEDYLQAKQRAVNKFIANSFLQRSDPKRFGHLLSSLYNAFLMKEDNYPVDMEEAIAMLTNYEDPNANKHKGNDRGNTFTSEMTFTNVGKERTCWKCGKSGHMKWEGKCKEADIKAHEAQKAKERGNSNSNTVPTHSTCSTN